MAQKPIKPNVIYPELSYQLNGLAFDVHNTLGRFAKERQYADLFELKLKDDKLSYTREFTIVGTGNRADFIIDDKILIELKAKPFLLKEDYYQVQRYLELLDLRLGLLINFQDRYVKPARILHSL